MRKRDIPQLVLIKTFITTCFIFLSSIAIGQSIWSVINPLPPVVDYDDVQFIDNETGWAISHDGLLINSINGGENWTILNNEVTHNPSCLSFLNLNNGWLTGWQGIYKTTDGGLTWELNFSIQESGFASIIFVSEQIAYANSQYGHIYKTTNGGQNWELKYELNTNSIKIYFTDELTGWTLNNYSVFKTTDGGESWFEIMVSSSPHALKDLHFVDENFGWIAADKNLLVHTKNGGLSWDTIPVPAQNYENFNVVHFFNETTGKVFSQDYCYLTLDGGISWEQIMIPQEDNLAVSLPTETFTCMVGENVYYSNDGGYNWESPDVGNTFYQTSMCLGEDQDIYIAGDGGKIVYSDDNGVSWIEQETPTDKYLTDICYVSENILWATGNDGIVLYTGNGGLIWNQIDIGTNKDLMAVSFASEQTGCCVGEYSKIFMTHDGGETWTDVSGQPSSTFNDVFFYNDYIGWLCGDNGVVLKTVDGGISWLLLNSTTTKNLYSISFIDQNKGWFTANELIISTDDGGQNWYTQLDDLPSPHSNDGIYSIHFTDSENGWATGRDGLLLHTKDGGANWVVHKRIIEEDLYAIQFRNINEGFAVGDEGYVLHTNQGSYLAPHITSQPGDTILCENNFISFECNAIGDSLIFQWKYGDELIPGANENTLTFDSISIMQGGLYSCFVSNGAGTITSDEFMVSIKPNTEITGHPQDEILHQNDTVILSLAVAGALPIHYQWQKNDVDIEGAIYNVYPIYGLQQADSGYYRCIVSNDCSMDTTNNAKVSVLPASSVQNIENEMIFSIVPNPVTSKCQISFDQVIDDGYFEIYSIMGKKILSGEILHTKSIKIDLSDLGPEIYLIKVNGNGKTYSSKFVKD